MCISCICVCPGSGYCHPCQLNDMELLRSDRTRHVEAHHYCNHRSHDFHQCVVYDSDEPNARLIGIEYIVTEKVSGGHIN